MHTTLLLRGDCSRVRVVCISLPDGPIPAIPGTWGKSASAHHDAVHDDEGNQVAAESKSLVRTSCMGVRRWRLVHRLSPRLL